MKHFLVFSLLAVFVSGDFIEPNEKSDLQNIELDANSEWNEYVKKIPRADEEDAHLLIPEIIAKYGYPSESHLVTTKDGYILNLHRIPYGKKGPGESRGVFFIQHGVLASSADWVIAGPGKGFGYMLADMGFDVWMGNARGNRYSRNHIKHDLNSKEFWDFSWHEIGTIDLPAMIDYILEKTNETQLFYAGHSQGTTAFFVMCSEKPSYNAKIKAQFSLAPIAFMGNLKSPLMRVLALAEGGLDFLLKLIGMYEFMPKDGFLAEIAADMCDGGITQQICKNSLFVLAGFNKEQFNMTLLPIMMGHTPAGSSTKQLLHFAQEMNSGKFRYYDYGLLGNMRRYAQFTPPEYNLGKVTAPVYLFYSKNDWMSNPKDVDKLAKKLKNLKGKFLNPDEKFNHLDYLFGIDANKLVYSKVISLAVNL